MTKREAFVEFLRKKAEAAGEIRSFEHFMAAVADYEMRAEAGDLDPEELALEALFAREPRCTCEDLIEEHDRLGKCISSSCEQHEWRLVNRIVEDKYRERQRKREVEELREELLAQLRMQFGTKLVDESLGILRGGRKTCPSCKGTGMVENLSGDPTQVVLCKVCCATGFIHQQGKNPKCPYPGKHAADCDCEGAGGDR